MRRIIAGSWIFTVLVVAASCRDASAVHMPREWLEKHRVRYDEKDRVLKGLAQGHYFVTERPGTWKGGPNLLVFTDFDGFCVIRGEREGIRLHPVSAGRIIRAGFGRDEGFEIGLFDRGFKRLFESKIGKPQGDSYLWASQCSVERATEVLTAHMTLGNALSLESRGLIRVLRQYSRSLNDPLFTYLFNLFGKDRDWLNPRWEGHPDGDYPRKPHERPGPGPGPADRPEPRPEPPAPPTPATPDRIETLIRGIDAASFSGDKLSILSVFCAENWVNVESAGRILPRFAFSSDRLKALEFLAPKIVDRDNSFVLLNSFQFSSDKEAARKILENARR